MKTSTLAYIQSTIFYAFAITMCFMNTYVLEYYEFSTELIFVALMYGSALQVFALMKSNEEQEDEREKE